MHQQPESKHGRWIIKGTAKSCPQRSWWNWQLFRLPLHRSAHPSMGIGISSLIFAIVLSGIAIIILRKCYKSCCNWAAPHAWPNMEIPQLHWSHSPMPMPVAPPPPPVWRYRALQAPLQAPAIDMVLPEMHTESKNSKQKYNWEV